MSFQAPQTDSDPGSGGFKAPDSDLEPKSLEGFLSNALSNTGRALNPLNIIKGGADQVKQGAFDIPLEATNTLANTVAKAVGGEETTEDKSSVEHLLQDPTMERRAEEVSSSEPVQKPIDFAYKNPVDTALTLSAAALPFMGKSGAAGGVRGTIEKASEAAGEAKQGAPAVPLAEEPPPVMPKPSAPNTPGSLPVKEPSHVGEPHGLFSYNSDMNPEGKMTSMYTLYGDKEHPLIKVGPDLPGAGNTTQPLDWFKERGIPVVGREPRSVGKWDPIESPAGGAGTPPPPPPGKPPSGPGGPPEGPELPPPGGKPSIFETGAEKVMDEAKELKDYVTRGYEGYAKKPGAMADVADWVQEKSQMMAAQQLGVTPNQARQLGKSPLASHNAMRAIGQYAMDHDIVSPTTGLGGMLEKNNALMKSVGKTLGGYREMADKLAGEIDPKDIAREVRKVLDKKYMRTITTPEGESSPRGAYGGQAGAYVRALQELEDAEKSHSGIADAATELNHAANKAAKNMQPETPFTDVANEVSRINNEKIKALIGKENAAKYEQALREYGVNKKIANALKFKSSGEVKRFGPGSTFSNLTQKAMDELGYRVGAKAANKLSTAIKNNPGSAGSLPSLFKEFIHQVEDVGHDVTGMSKGGIVPDDVKRYVSSRC